MDGITTAAEVRAGGRAVGDALQRALDELAKPDAASDALVGPARFQVVWKQETDRPATRAQIEHFAAHEEPRDAIPQLVDAVHGLRDLLQQPDAPLTKLLLAVTLAVADRLVRKVAPCSMVSVDGVEVPMAELLAASVVACAWLDAPLLVRHGATPQPANVLTSHPPIEFDLPADEKSALSMAAMQQELEQFHVRHSLGWTQMQPGGSVEALLSGLKRLRTKRGIVPVVALQQGNDRHALSQSAQRQTFAERFGVPLFVYGPSAAPAAMQALEIDLLNYLNSALSGLFHTPIRHEEPSPMSPATTRTKVFISYAREDDAARLALRKVLKNLERKGVLEVWDDCCLNTGDDWRKGIDSALTSCRVAFLLLSNDFLASDFIHDVEMPRIFERLESSDSLWVYPILIGGCDWEGEALLKARQVKRYNDKPFNSVSKPEQDEAIAEVAKEIRERLAGTGK